jgi:excisionase family DNA binding protein
MPTTQHPPPIGVKLKVAAEMLGVSEASLRRKIKIGELKAIRAFRHITISIEELKRFQERNSS